jgi:hypothetical protein
VTIRRPGPFVALLLTTPLYAATACYEGGRSPSDDPANEPGGADDGADDDGAQDASFQDFGCVETSEHFRDRVWAPFMSTQCYACHNPEGQAKHTDLVLRAVDVPGYFDANLAALADVARLEIDGTSLLLLKPTGQVEHGGGVQLPVDDDRYRALEELVWLMEEPVHCADDGDYAAFFEGVELLDLEQTLRRAMSRRPTSSSWCATAAPKRSRSCSPTRCTSPSSRSASSRCTTTCC